MDRVGTAGRSAGPWLFAAFAFAVVCLLVATNPASAAPTPDHPRLQASDASPAMQVTVVTVELGWVLGGGLWVLSWGFNITLGGTVGLVYAGLLGLSSLD